jgi:hypothetical protein
MPDSASCLLPVDGFRSFLVKEHSAGMAPKKSLHSAFLAAVADHPSILVVRRRVSRAANRTFNIIMKSNAWEQCESTMGIITN